MELLLRQLMYLVAMRCNCCRHYAQLAVSCSTGCALSIVFICCLVTNSFFVYLFMSRQTNCLLQHSDINDYYHYYYDDDDGGVGDGAANAGYDHEKQHDECQSASAITLTTNARIYYFIMLAILILAVDLFIVYNETNCAGQSQ